MPEFEPEVPSHPIESPMKVHELELMFEAPFVKVDTEEELCQVNHRSFPEEFKEATKVVPLLKSMRGDPTIIF